MKKKLLGILVGLALISPAAVIAKSTLDSPPYYRAIGITMSSQSSQSCRCFEGFQYQCLLGFVRTPDNYARSALQSDPRVGVNIDRSGPRLQFKVDSCI